VSRRYRFGRFELDGEVGELLRDGEPVALQDLPFRLLVSLVEGAPAVVSREALRDRLWPPGTHLDVDASLNTAVARVREALGDDASAPRFVATVPRRGYRFTAAVEVVGDGSATRWPGGWPAAVVVGVALVALGVWWTASALRGGGGPGPSNGVVASSADGQGSAREQLVIGRHYAERRSREGFEKAIAAYQSAVAVEPESAEAYSALAASYALLGIYDFWRPREAFGPAETMARKALELDPDSAEAHLSMALVAAVVHWDWVASEEEVERAVALAPDSSEAWFWRGALLSSLGRHREGIESIRRALVLEPTSPVINAALAWHLFLARRGDEAIAQSHHAIDLYPDYYDTWDNLKWIEVTLNREGDHEAAAVEAWARAEALEEGDGADGEAIRRIYAEGGLELLHRKSIEGQTARWRAGRYQSPYDIVLEHAALGEVDEALAWLERSFAERETDLTGLAVDPRLDVLRGDPRFRELLGRMGFP